MIAPKPRAFRSIGLAVSVLFCSITLSLSGCSSGSVSTRHTGSTGGIYGDFYYDRWYWGSCCYYPGYPIGPPRPPRPKPEHPIERPLKPKPEHPIARPPRPMPRPLPAARPGLMR